MVIVVLMTVMMIITCIRKSNIWLHFSQLVIGYLLNMFWGKQTKTGLKSHFLHLLMVVFWIWPLATLSISYVSFSFSLQ